MAAPWTLRIYGADTDVSGDAPDKTTVEAIAGVQYMEITTGWVRPEPQFEDSPIEYLDGTKTSPWRIRIGYNVELATKYFPVTGTTVELYYKTDVLNKKYKWCWFNDFPLRPAVSGSVIANTKVKAIAITGYSVDHSQAGIKKISFTMQNRSRS